MPALYRFTGIGFLVNPDKPLLPVQPGIHSILTACDQNSVKAQLTGPIGILCGQLYHRIAPQGQISGNGIAVFIRCVIVNSLSVGIPDPESPATQVVAGVRGFHNLNAAIVGVGKGDAGRLVCLDHNGFHRRIETPIGIVCGNFFGIQRSGLQTGYSHSSVTSGSKGRAGDRFSAGRICVQANLPTT